MLELLNAKIDSNAEVNKARFDQLDNKINSNAVANKANFDRLDSKIESNAVANKARFDQLDNKIDSNAVANKANFDRLDSKIESNAVANKARFDQLDNKIDSNAVANKANFDRLDSKDESTNTRIDDFIKTIDSRFASIESKLETNYKTIVTFGTIITITIGLVGFLQRRRSPSLSTRTTPSVAPSLESSEVMAESMPKTKSEPESKRDSRV